MDGGTILAFATMLVVFVAGVVFALCAIWLTRNRTEGRGAIVVLAFFIPALYVAYLLAARQFRNEYHRARSNAYESDGYNNLMLGNGYVLWFYDETPWMSSIGRGSANAQITNIQRLSTDGAKIVGQTGRTNMEDGPTDYYFLLDTATGTLHEFATQAELSSTIAAFRPLRRPEDLYNAEIDREHSGLFWPLVCLAPVGLATSLFSVGLRRRNSATLRASETSSMPS
jgi:hypothetical protein